MREETETGSMDMGTATATTTAMSMTMTMAMSMAKPTATMAMGHSSASMAMASTSKPMGSMKMSCTMSMLWNWYTDDVCLISDQWKTSTKAIFGGSCVGVFALLVILNWWRRILSQYRIHCAEVRELEVRSICNAGVALKEQSKLSHSSSNNMISDLMIPFVFTWRHDWLKVFNGNLAVKRGDQLYIYPSPFEHLLYCMGDTIEWSVHHVVMLLFMYFNGYIFISCMIGAGVGFLLFQFKNLPTSSRGDNVSKRCCL